MVDNYNTPPKEKLVTVKILPDDHTALMHIKADTGKTLYQIISEMVQARRAQQQPHADGTQEDA